MNVKDIRRENLRALAKQAGGITAVAKRLDKSQSQISHVIGATPVKNIGDKFAAQVEKAFAKPPGWLDREHEGIAANYIDNQTLDDTHKLSWVPILHWNQIPQWNAKQESIKHIVKEYIPVNFNISETGYAAQLPTEALNEVINQELAKDIYIIVEPQKTLENGQIVLVHFQAEQPPTLCKYEKHQDSIKLISLNTHEQMTSSNFLILGPVISMQHNIN